jgi:hypothetical protein
MTQKMKQILIAGAVIIVAFFGFKMFFSSDVATPDGTLAVDQSVRNELVEGQKILALLNQLSNIKLDPGIFSDQTFNSLVSFEKPIGEQVVGRSNPFMPIGRDSEIMAPQKKSTSTPNR